MKHIPRKPREGINVSKTHPLVEASTLVVGLSLIFVAIVIALVFLIEIALYFVPVDKEARLFRNFLPDDVVTVAPMDERLYQTQLLADRLASHWADAPYEIRVEIDDSTLVNALAFPGGLIIVTSGLLDEVASENELAFVLAHELGHFRNRDHLRALGRSTVLSLFFSVVMGSDASGISIKVADLTLRGFSRTQESRADAFGLALVQAEYGHVNDAWRLFERDMADGDLADIFIYVSTHPDSGDRVENLRRQAEREGWPTSGEVSPLRW